MKTHRCCLLFPLLMLLFFIPVSLHAQTNTKQVKIAAYNLWNMFDIYDNPYSEDEATRVKPYEQIKAVAQVIKEINADIVGCVELENKDILKAMTLDFLPDAGYEYFATTDSNSGRGIQIGVMSKLPILSITSHKFRTLTLPNETKTWHFARDLVQVTVQLSDKQILDLFIVHFKSKRSGSGDPKSNKWRLAEATMAKNIIAQTKKQFPDHWIAMVGDFNDTPESGTIQHLLDGNLLTDTHKHIPDANRITYLKKPYRSTIDFILAGPDMVKKLIQKQTGQPADESKLTGSDHAPIYSTFSLN